MTPQSQPQLKRSLRLWQLVVSGVGIVIGAGIYVLVGDAAAEAGGLLWLSFVLAGLLALMTAMSYAELAGLFPTAGAEYEFARQAFNDFVGFLAGWLMIGALIVASAAVAVGFGSYLQWFVDVDARYSAVALLGFLSMLVVAGVQRSMWLSVLLVILQIGGLAFVVVAGIPHFHVQTSLDGHGTAGVLSAAALVFFAFIGFDEVITLSEETTDPGRVIPKALLLSLGISTLLYIAVGVAAVSAVGADALGASRQPLGLVLDRTFGPNAGDVIAFVALASTTNTALLALTSATRMIFDMARDGALPPRLATLSVWGATPWVAALAAVAVAMPFAVSGSIELIAQVTNFGVYILFIVVNLALIRLRQRFPDAHRPFRSPFTIRGIPLTAIGGLLTSVLLLAYVPRDAWMMGLLLVASGVLAWFASPYLGRKGLAPTVAPPDYRPE